MCEAETTSTVIVTKEHAISNTKKSLDACSEAVTLIFVLTRDAMTDGKKSIIIMSVDMDVLVIAISVLPFLKEICLEKMWIAFGQRARWNGF